MFDAVASTYTVIPDNHTLPGSLLYGAYPNPCSNELTLWFENEESQNINITLFDMTGRFVASIVNASFSPGRHLLPIHVSSLPGGVYQYIINENNNMYSGRVSIVR